MNPLLGKRQKEGLARLLLGFALNIPLYLLVHPLAGWSSIEREIHLSLIAGSLAIATLVFVTPVFLMMQPTQRGSLPMAATTSCAS